MIRGEGSEPREDRGGKETTEVRARVSEPREEEGGEETTEVRAGEGVNRSWHIGGKWGKWLETGGQETHGGNEETRRC